MQGQVKAKEQGHFEIWFWEELEISCSKLPSNDCPQ